MDAKAIMGAAVSFAIIGVAGVYIYSKVDEMRNREQRIGMWRSMRDSRAANGQPIVNGAAVDRAAAKQPGNT